MRPLLLAVSELQPFPVKWSSSEQNGPLSSLRCSKIIKPQEGVAGASAIQLAGQSTGLAMASVGRSPRPAGSDALLGGECENSLVGHPTGVRELLGGVGICHRLGLPSTVVA